MATSLEQLIPDWLAAYPTNTAQAYQRDLTQFASWHDGPLDTVDRARAQAYINHLQKADLADPTIRRKRSACSSFYDYALGEDQVRTNPFAKVRTPKGGTNAKLGLSTEQSLRLLDAARIEGPTAYAIIALLVTTGVRISGAVKAQVSDLSTDAGHQILRVTLKGGRTKRLPLAPNVLQAINELAVGQSEGPIFLAPRGGQLTRVTAGRWITRIGKSAGLGHITPHILRHTCAGLLAAAGTDPRRIQDLLGHRSIQSTMNYVHLVESLEDSPAYQLADQLMPGAQ